MPEACTIVERDLCLFCVEDAAKQVNCNGRGRRLTQPSTATRKRRCTFPMADMVDRMKRPSYSRAAINDRKALDAEIGLEFR